jgi:hypothetical protein
MVEVNKEHAIPYNLGWFINAGHPMPYDAGPFVNSEHASPYDLGTFIEVEHIIRHGSYVETDHVFIYYVTIEAEHGLLYSLNAFVNAEHSMLYDLLDYTEVDAEHKMLYGSFIEAEHGLLYSLQGELNAEHGMLYSSMTEINDEHGMLYNLLAYNEVNAEHGLLFHLGLPPVFDITDSIAMYHNGNKIDILGASIKQDEGDPFYAASIELAYVKDYVAIAQDDDISLILGGVTFNFIVDTKEKSRAFGSVSMSLEAVSPGLALTSPRATLITKTWPAIMAQDAAEEALGQAIDWQMIDWMIQTDRLSVTDAEPLEIARTIVEAAGGVLQSKPDGTFLARPLFPVSVPAWLSAVPDSTLTDYSHNLTAQEMYRRTERVTKVTIRDTSGESTQDMTDYIANETDAKKGILYVYPRPWRPISVAHTGHAAVGLTYLGVKYLTKTEFVEFKAGMSSVAFPVDSITSVNWQYKNLGSLSFSGQDLTSAVNGYSLANVTYKTKSLAYAVSDTIDETIQFLVMEQ